MKKRLVKIYLSKKPAAKNVMMCLLGLLVITTLFFSEALGWFDSYQLLSANGQQVFVQKEYWRIFTTSLIHADLNHLALNSLVFVLLALLLNTYFGIFIFPFISFIAGGVINLMALKYYPLQVTLVGISGVIYFMAAFWMTLYGFIERRISVFRRIINSLAMSLIFFFPQGGILEKNVSYSSHSIGFGLGLLIGVLYYFFYQNKFSAAEVWEEIPTDMDDELLIFLSLNHDAIMEEQNKNSMLSES